MGKIMPIFSDGLEDGDFRQYSGTDGTPTVEAAPVHHGSWSAECNPGAWSNEDFYKSIGNQGATIYCRWYQRFENEVPSSGNYFRTLKVRNQGSTGDICYVEFINDGGTKKVRVVSTTPAATYAANFTLTVNQWYCFELKIVIDAANGEYHLWIDGIEYISQTGLNTGASNPDYYFFGHAIFGNIAVTSNTDCIVIDTSYIGVEGGAGLSIPVAMHHYGHHINKIIRG
jgi:hypothetical protein